MSAASGSSALPTSIDGLTFVMVSSTLLSAIPKADGQGQLPAAPAAEAPPEWTSEVPQALERV